MAVGERDGLEQARLRRRLERLGPFMERGSPEGAGDSERGSPEGVRDSERGSPEGARDGKAGSPKGARDSERGSPQRAGDSRGIARRSGRRQSGIPKGPRTSRRDPLRDQEDASTSGISKTSRKKTERGKQRPKTWQSWKGFTP